MLNTVASLPVLSFLEKRALYDLTHISDLHLLDDFNERIIRSDV